ncbi:MAG: hypothetical protein AB9866_08075 [Syntrophobacteraceae bacterium]
MLTKTPIARTVRLEDGESITLKKGQKVSCGLCHSDPLQSLQAILELIA